MRVRGAAGTVVLMTLLGCAGIPPKPRPVVLPSEAPFSEQNVTHGQWPREQWWRAYRDPSLDQLIDLALTFSPSLGVAQARFESARQSVRIAASESGAHVDVNGSFERQRLSDNGLFPPRLLGFNWYNQADLGLKASYNFDWWGKQRDSLASAMDEAHAAQADHAASELVLASSVADTYFGWQADQSRLALNRERLVLLQRTAAIDAARERAELESADILHRSDADLAALREQIAVLDASARLRVVTLAALLGKSVSELPVLEVKPLPAIVAGLPERVRVDLMARRPDITASRWRVEATEKNLNVARAVFFPDVSLNALIGLSSLRLAKLLEAGSGVSLAGAAIRVPLFDGGRLQARYSASQALVTAAVASYRETLVNAAREVSMLVETRMQIGVQQTQRLIALDAAQRLRESAAARVRQGIADSRTELAAIDSWLLQREGLMQLNAAAISADIGLQRALGGGYESTQQTAISTPLSMTAAP